MEIDDDEPMSSELGADGEDVLKKKGMHCRIYTRILMQDAIVASLLVCAEVDDTVLDIAHQVEARLKRMWKLPVKIRKCEAISGENVPDSILASEIADSILVCHLPDSNEILCLACGSVVLNPSLLECGHTVHSHCLSLLASDEEYKRGLICVKCPVDDSITQFSRRRERQSSSVDSSASRQQHSTSRKRRLTIPQKRGTVRENQDVYRNFGDNYI
uniref:RING-type domain-containing protein n=1 Tax=Aureoumbra lagunensis TaxID=44058 RepID=A0A7S3K3W6_9STRA|mmetsp:Transcript_2456/g.3935  ORF Transcript_2456/g.3935 Transcript_2456/m.3935 type:complete len:216 (+) Transcript_2456:56-703(+)